MAMKILFNNTTLSQFMLPYSLKFLRDKIFTNFVGQRMAAKVFSREISLLRNFKFITDARRGWKLDYKNFKFVFEQSLAKLRNI